ncbi:unnamed protein product, partial [Laminaria digitata]
MFVRPEAVAGTIHNVIHSKHDVDFDASLLNNTESLEKVAARNGEINGRPGVRDRTYLLSRLLEI